MDALTTAGALLAHAQNIVIFTGAGVSTESGIPDFRSPDTGLYRRFASEDLFSIQQFRSRPERFYAVAEELFTPVTEARPNDAHRGIAEIARRGQGGVVVTQNIDGLHQAAGSPDVIELHGSGRTGHCLTCGADYTMESVFTRLKQGENPPYCTCGGVIKPDVTFFGEMLPEGALERGIDCAVNADVLIVVGSSLTVMPAAYVPEEAIRAKVPVVIINKTPTPYDRFAAAILREPAGGVFRALNLVTD